MAKALVEDRGLQNTSRIRFRSVQCREIRPERSLRTIQLNFSCSIPPDEQVREFTLDPYTSVTSITDLTPDLDYSVSINSFDGSEESIPIFGQLTSKCTFVIR